MYTPVHTHTCIHTYMHTHTETGLVPLAVTLGSYFSHCIHKACTSIFVTNTHTHTHTHTHTDWACTTCRYFGFLFLTLFSQIVHVHECTHMCTHTHAYAHAHTHTQTGLVPLAVTLGSYYSRSTYMCNNTPCIVM